MATDTRSSPPPPEPSVTRTGSLPAVSMDVAMRPETIAERALRISLHNRSQIGHAPVEATGDPGEGLWAAWAKTQAVCLKVLAWTEAADKASEMRGGWSARIGWKVLETLIPLGIIALLAWVAGFHR